MNYEDNDNLDRASARALGTDEAPVHAPEGFVARTESRLYFASLLERRRRIYRAAATVGAGSIALMAGVLALFVQTVDAPGWVMENVPGILGRFDAVRVAAERSPGAVLAALGASALVAAGVLSAALRPQRN